MNDSVLIIPAAIHAGYTLRKYLLRGLNDDCKQDGRHRTGDA